MQIRSTLKEIYIIVNSKWKMSSDVPRSDELKQILANLKWSNFELGLAI